MDALEIRMQSRPGIYDPCCVRGCRNNQSGSHSLPVFNGDIVSNEWPGEYGASGCCEECYEAHQRGEIPTADHLYSAYLDSLGMFSEGAGI